MKRRVLSLIIALALCLNLCPMRALAADDGTGGGLCPHHLTHTDACGYVAPTPEQECTHSHDDGCYTTKIDCIHEHTAECYLDSDYDPETDEPVLCTHVCTQDSGCVTRTLSCVHEHDDTCGYVPGNSGAPCTFVCRICPIEDLIGKLPSSVSAYNSEQVQAQLIEIYTLYDGLTGEEQQQVDLSHCAALQERIDEMGIAVVSDDILDSILDLLDDPNSANIHRLKGDESYTSPYQVVGVTIIDTNGHTLTGPNSSAIQVTAASQLYLVGTVISNKGAGVEVLSNGFLNILGTGTAISGTTYALDIASGAEVHLSAGTYTGGSAAIRMADNNFAALLEPGYAFFDESGNAILSENASAAKTLVVRQCTDHANRTYVTNAGTISHTWTCQACKAQGTELCTFTFDMASGKGTCALCGNEVTVTVDRGSLKELAYDTSNSVKPANGTVIVTAEDGTVLTEDIHYTVDYSTHADTGSTNVTVTVTVVMGTDNGTFTKDYTFTKDELTRPVLEWDTTVAQVPVTVPYDGDPVEAGDLPSVIINITSDVDLHPYLQYSYRVQGDTAYTNGLPTNAGIYEVVVTLPEKPEIVPDYEAASSEPITLIINKISPIITAPAAIDLTFDRTTQTLVTAGTLHGAAARDGVVITFATGENDTYSTTIPTGFNAGEYDVWYRTEATENFLAVGPLKIDNVEILRKPITPIVSLSKYTYLYTGGYHEPDVEVKDEDDVTVLLDTEYQVTYKDNRDVGTATVEVSDKTGGNYEIKTVTAQFKITSKTQEALSITNKRDTVAYGDEFTLNTLGGSGNGNVTWEIVTDAGDDGSATINPTSGRIKITGAGTITVKATKSGIDPETNIQNYDDATAVWTFVADKKAVIATVTAEDKDYNGSAEAEIHAVVEQGVVSGDEITINGLIGTFSDGNAGVDKTVTVDVSGATISGTNSQHYEVSYSNLTVTATIRKAVATIKSAPDAANLTYSGNAQALIDASNLLVDPSGILVEYALSEEGPYSTDIPEETNAGTYTVWYRIQETDNYTGLPQDSVNVTIKKKTVTPVITLSGDGLDTDNNSASPMQYYIYDGTAKEPTVTLTEADGTTVISDTEYMVSYSNNTNVGTATVTVTAKDDGNYSFNGTATKNFRIDKKQAEVITRPEEAGDPLTYNTRAQKLVTAGVGLGGTMVYCVGSETGAYLPTIPTATNADVYTVYYKVKGDDNHSDSNVGSVVVTIAPKTVKDPTIELELVDDNGDPIDSYTYDGTPKKPAVVVKDGSTVIGTTDSTGVNDEYNVIYTNNVDAGTATVNITDKTGGNYTVTGSTTFVIVKADIVFNPAPSAANITYDGKAHELLIPGTPNGGEVFYALNSPNTTFNAAVPTATEAGDYVVYYKVTGDKNYNDLAVQSVSVTIERKPLDAITIELDPDSFVYDGQVHLPEVTVKDGNTVLPEEEYTWKCTLNGTAADAPTIQGIYTITIEDASGGNYDLGTLVLSDRQATFAIDKTTQEELVIDHSNVTTTNYGDKFTLSTRGGTDTGTVTWSVAGSAATVDASTGEVEITGVGEVTITATNAGDDNYLPISAQWTFTAMPKPVTASVAVADKDYDGTTDATVDLASITVINGDDVTIDETSITAEFDTASVGTGKTVTLDTTKVQLTGNDAEKYAISYPSTVTANINKATTQITTAPKAISSLTYNGQPQAVVTPGESNVGFIVYSLNGTDFSPEIPAGTDAGTYNVYYKVDGTADYTGVAVNTTAITVTIAPKTVDNPVIEPAESSYLYNGTKQEPKITVKDGRTVIDDDQYTVTWKNDDPAITEDILTAAGSYTATIENVSGGNYSFSATATVEIVPASQAALNITGQPEHVYYGDKITTLGTSGGSGNGTLTWSIMADGATSTINSATGELTVTDTGSITVKAERTVPNYGPVSDTWTFTVEPKPVTAVVTITAKDYDGTTAIDAADIVAAVNVSDLVDPSDTFTVSGLAGAYTNANAGTNKTVTLDASNAATTADTDKYAVSYPATAKADINRRTVTVTVELSGNDLKTDSSGSTPVYSYEYDGTEKTPIVTVTADDNGATLAASDYTFSYANNKNVGTNASVTVKCAEGGNYDFGDKTVYFEIKSTAAVLVSTPQAKKLTYNGMDQDLVTVGVATGGTVVYSLSPIDPDDEDTYSENIPQGQNAGVYTVYYMVKGDTNHEDAGISYVSVTIDRKEIVSPVVEVNVTYTYDGTAKEPSKTDVEVKDDGMVIPGTEYTLSYRDNTDAGIATVIITNANGGNYIVNGMGTFTITKAPAEIETPPGGLENLPYNGAAQALATAGSASGGTMVYSQTEEGEYSTAIPMATAVGPYKVWYKVQGDGNHNDTTPVSVDASIVKNTVSNPTIQVTPETVTYNSEKQEPTITVKDDKGFEIDGSEYEVTYADAEGKPVTNLTNVGQYTLTITGVDGGNYEFEDEDDQNTAGFEILPAGQEPLTITGTREQVYYGDKIQLGTTGGNGTVTWTVDDGSTVAAIDGNGLLAIKGVGSVTVTATSKATGYTDQTATWRLYADKKPVTAIVTAASMTYNGDTETTVTATLQASDLVDGDSVTITLSGSFADPNVGTDKKVNIDSTNPGISGTNSDKYAITYPDTTTASILKADIQPKDVTAPTVAGNLVYTSIAQNLVVKAGSAMGGTMEYSTDGTNFSASLPTGTNADDYDVWYRVKGDSNHNDVDAVKLDDQVTIAKQEVTKPIIEFTPNSVSYDGAVHKPVVAVKDNNGRTIPDTEYTVTYGGTDWKTAGDHTVTITGKTDGNYDITETDETFTILMMGQNPLSIVGQPGRVQYGDTFTLSAVGGSGTGAVTWQSTTDTATITSGGLVTIVKPGSVTITATKAADDNYGAVSVAWTFNAEKKAVTPIVTAKDKEYDTKDIATLVITWKDGDLVGGDTINLDGILTGQFDTPAVGTGKTVKINGTVPESDKYDVTIPATTTASITPAAASVSGGVTPQLTYTGSSQELISGVTATNGTVVYSTNGITFTRNIPTGTNAGKYTFWYKALADENYKDSAVVEATVTIAPKTVTNPVIVLSQETFEYDGTAKKPDVEVKDGNTVIPASEYTISYSNNTAVSTDTAQAKVTISNADGGNYIVNGSTNFTITAGEATLTGTPQAKSLTYNGNAQELVTDGTAVNGQVVYSLTGNDDYTPFVPTGINAGTYTVYYKVKGANGASDTAARMVYVTIQPKPVNNPDIMTDLEEDTVPYTNTAYRPEVLAVLDGNTRIPATEYTVTYKNNTNPGTATIYVISKSSSNYDIYATATFEIVKTAAKFTQNPTGKTLTYNGTAQKLVEQGNVEGGIAYYSLDGSTYSPAIPTGVDVDQYIILAKVVGDSTHADSDPISITAEIVVNEPEKLTVELSGNSFSYTGSAIKPTVTVYDENGNIIPASEYTVTYSNNTEVGEATVRVTSKGSNYKFAAETKFEIVGADQTPLEITGKKDAVYYGDTLNLGTIGGNGGGVVTWEVVSGLATKLSDGQFKIDGSGMVTITATKAASTGYEAATDTWTFYASPRPATAIVTAADKPYDGKVDAELRVTVTGLLSGDTIPDGSITVEGYFTDEKVGTGKTVIIKLTILDTVSKKYEISYPDTITASITQAPPEVTAPTVAGQLTYDGTEQSLLTDDGSATGGNIMYSLDGDTYTFNIPTAKDAGTYTVWYKVAADSDNYKDSAPAKAGTVTIAPNTGTPRVLCTPDTFQYDGTAKTPTVVARDTAGRIIPEDEYEVTFGTTAIAVGAYPVTVKDKPGGNYEFTDILTADFEIVAASQNPLSIVTDIPTNVCYGDTFRLSATGGSGSGEIKWSIAENNVATIDSATGVVTVTGIGAFTVEAYREASGGYDRSNTASVPFYANPKPITPVVTAANKPYDGTKTATLTVSLKAGDLVGDDDVTLTMVDDGVFETANVGDKQQVAIPLTSHTEAGSDLYKYVITWPDSTTASIYMVDAKLETKPGDPVLTYNGNLQELVTPGTTVDGIGTIEYSTSQYGDYSEDIPTAKDAGTYTVWYRVANSVNYTGIAAASIEVKIAKAQPSISARPTASGVAGKTLGEIGFSADGVADIAGEFAWEDGSIVPENGREYNVIFTPEDTANYETVTFTILVTINSDPDTTNPDTSTPDTSTPGTTNPGTNNTNTNNPGTNSASMQTTVQNGTASTVVSAAAGSRLVKEAVENQSERIIIKPEITEDVTKTEVSIPASTVNQIKSETNAALTVSAPIADVTIPNTAMDTLGSAGGTVSVVTEQVDQAVVLTLTAGGKTVDSVPGGVTLTVPAEDAGPGTVAVLVHDDGTRETVQKSIVEDGKISIPLDGSATVEIVDNSKEFDDVSPTSWEADAVAFASAHELFSGTSETTFSPNQNMSRGMLATVLYRLEGCPDQDLAVTYGDVSSDAWYAQGVAWAAENGIANGYGNGEFGPNDNITREQFVVMLWNYAGKPTASGQALDFTDADQASGYALEALRWAVENGILSGFGNGQLVPGGTATRAQAAQMLKNFMESI